MALTTQQAQMIALRNLPKALFYDDLIDIRTQKEKFNLYSCRSISNYENCALIVANNLEECKKYVANCVNSPIDWSSVQIKTNGFTGACNVGQVKADNSTVFVVHITSKWTTSQGQPVLQNIKDQLKN